MRQQKYYLKHVLFGRVNVGDQMTVHFHKSFWAFSSAEKKQKATTKMFIKTERFEQKNDF
jgi:hypothetical protein